MSTKKQNLAQSGWVEALFRLENAPEITSMKLDPAHYMMFGGPLPILEFDGCFSVYEAYGVESWEGTSPEGYTRKLPESFPRRLQAGDCLNLVLRHPTQLEVLTFVLLHKKTVLKMQLGNQGEAYRNRIEREEGYDVVLCPPTEDFFSFAVYRA